MADCCHHDHDSKSSSGKDDDNHNHNHNHSHDHAHSYPWNVFLGFFCGLAAFWNGFSPGTHLVLLAIAASPLGRGALRFLSSDFLMLISGTAAIVLGHFEEAAILFTLNNLGVLLEHFSVDLLGRKFRTMVEKLVGPVQTSDGKWKNPEDLKISDVYMLGTGATVPKTSVLESDHAIFSSASLTGESTPHFFQKNDPIEAGMVLESGSIRLRVVNGKSQLDILKKLATQGMSSRLKISASVDIFTRFYTPLIVLAASFAGFHKYTQSDSVEEAIFMALSLLVLGCPCVFGLLPRIFSIGSMIRLSRRSIWVKTPKALENLVNVSHVLLDKTGTLTENTMTLVNKKNISQENLEKIAALEMSSSHPAARAFENISTNISAQNVRPIPGFGIQGEIDGRTYHVVNHRYLDENKWCDNHEGIAVYESEGLHPLFLYADGKSVEVLLEDRIRTETPDVLKSLEKLGLSWEIVSGDSRPAVARVAGTLGNSNFHAELTPEGKALYSKKLRDQGRNIVAIGDGLNDTGFLSHSNTSIAFRPDGRLGLTIQAADIIVTEGTLEAIPLIFKEAKYLVLMIFSGLAFATGMKIGTAMFAFMVHPSISASIAADTGLTLTTVILGMAFAFAPRGLWPR